MTLLNCTNSKTQCLVQDSWWLCVI